MLSRNRVNTYLVNTWLVVQPVQGVWTDDMQDLCGDTAHILVLLHSVLCEP